MVFFGGALLNPVLLKLLLFNPFLFHNPFLFGFHHFGFGHFGHLGGFGGFGRGWF